jgi:hypothetical protein
VLDFSSAGQRAPGPEGSLVRRGEWLLDDSGCGVHLWNAGLRIHWNGVGMRIIAFRGLSVAANFNLTMSM